LIPGAGFDRIEARPPMRLPELTFFFAAGPTASMKSA
jgi:hypothetical protein